MTRGRKRKPTKMLDLHGAFQKNPQRARPNEPQFPEGLPECPDHLEGHAVDEWFRVGSMLAECGVMTHADAAALEQYCEAYAAWRDACAKVQKYGPVLLNKKPDGTIMAKRNPYDLVREKNANMCVRMLSEFGLTPSSRTRVEARQKEEHDPFAEFMRRRTQNMEGN